MKRILVITILVLFNVAYSYAQTKRYVITYLSNDTSVSIGTYGNFKEFRQSDTIDIASNFTVVFKAPNQVLELIDLNTAEEYVITDEEFRNSHSRTLYGFFQTHKLLTMGDDLDQRRILIRDKILIPYLDDGSYMIVAGQKTELHYREGLGAYIEDNMLPFEDNEFLVELFYKDSTRYCYPFVLKVIRDL